MWPPMTVRVATLAALCAVIAASAVSTARTQGGGHGGLHASTGLMGSTIEGRWKTKKASLHELLAAGLLRKDALAFVHAPLKTPALDFHNGTYKGLDLATGRVLSTGSYKLEGDLIRFVFRRGIAVRRGVPYWMRWSVYRDRLTFSSVPDRQTLGVLTIRPWTRVR
jgi:hypothetical protein